MPFSLRHRLRQCALDPGVIFPCANLFAFLQSHDPAAIVVASLNVAASIAASLFMKGHDRLLAQHPTRAYNFLRQFCMDQLYSPLRITAIFSFSAGLVAALHGVLLPAIAGCAFGFGNWLGSSPSMAKMVERNKSTRWIKVLLHPAIYYGIGYSMTGLLAGGGMQLLHNPADNMAAAVMTGIGITSTTISCFGLALGRFQNATPFWIVASGSAINSLAGLLNNNPLGVINCLLSMSGELRLGFLTRQNTKRAQV